MPSDFLVDGQVSGLGTVQSLLTLSFFSTRFLPLFKRKTLSSAMDGLQKRETYIPCPNMHPKASIKPPAILQAMVAHNWIRGCTFLLKVCRRHPPQLPGKLAPIIDRCEDLWSKMHALPYSHPQFTYQWQSPEVLKHFYHNLRKC